MAKFTRRDFLTTTAAAAASTAFPGLAAAADTGTKLLHAPDQAIVASHTFLQADPAASTDTATVASAFGTALGTVGHDIAGWVLRSGDEHERTHPRE